MEILFYEILKVVKNKIMLMNFFQARLKHFSHELSMVFIAEIFACIKNTYTKEINPPQLTLNKANTNNIDCPFLDLDIHICNGNLNTIYISCS